MDAWPASTGEALHTSTFLGNPLGCATALAAIAEHTKPATLAAAKQTGKLLAEALRALDSKFIGNIRGIGAMMGVELIHENGTPNAQLGIAIVKAALKDGIVLLSGGPDGNVLSFAPPFCLTKDEAGFLRRKLQGYPTSPPGTA